ncbi:MAG: PilC/PilY family type IV pilus protein [Usitatibacter sp.]
MNRTETPNPAARILRAAIALALGAAPGLAAAALTDLAQAPIATSGTTIVKPNVSFVLDTSGSMASLHAPDEASPFASRYGYKSSQCNSIYYNPSITYAPPKNSNNTDFANSSFTGAWIDGFSTADGTVNLSTQFTANSGDAQQAAYYYTYSGSQVVNFLTNSNTFYKECNSSIGSTPGKTVFTYVKVTASSGPNGTDERVNFANWYSYYRSRILMMKSGAGRAFATIGDNYRIGFMTIYATPSNNTSASDYLKISDFDQTQKDAWYKRFYAQDPSGNTPLKKALSVAGRNFAGVLGPDPIQYSCQQNFTILTTDGYWNNGTADGVKVDGSSSIGNQDNNAANTPAPMFDGNLGGSSNTLADVAAYYYSTDLRPGSNCFTGFGGADVCEDNVPVSGLDDNPAQHMTTFTVGLGVNGQLGFADSYLTGGSADFNAIAAGSKNWPVPVGDKLTTIDDLWHAAVNGHGQYFSAKNPDSLVSGLRSALAGVSAREAAGSAAATSNLEPVAGDNYAFVANYRTQKWDGDVEARLIDLTTGAISTTSIWSAQTVLDTMVTDISDSRTIFTYLNNAKTMFIPASFTAAQKTAWFTPSASPPLGQFAGWTVLQKAAATPDSLINFLRGWRGNEQRAGNLFPIYRQRDHVLGDIIDGKPVYGKVPPFNYTENGYQGFKTSLATRQGVVYAAANDGMLHAFATDTGKEMWAYVPSFVLPNLKALADDNYANAHQYYVDGSPLLTDVWNGSAWRTIIVGGLNGGGKGYYALDVTSPTSPQILWEYTSAQMGFSFGNPVVGKLADGSWNVFITSGYNNADGVGRLFVLNAMTGALKYTLSTAVGSAVTPSGLSRINAWTDDGLADNSIKRLYGGDLLGNLWRFDVNDIIPPAGREATRLALFKVGTYLQPITVKPELGLVSNKPVVFVGTGKYLGASDLSDLNQQSLYAIRDDLTAAGVGDVRNSPVAPCTFRKQTLNVINANSRSVTGTAVDMSLAAGCGWYIDFNPANSTPGERMNIAPKLQLGVLVAGTNIPEKSICTLGGSSFLYFFDYQQGLAVNPVPGTTVGQRLPVITVGDPIIERLPDGRVVAVITTADDKRPVFPVPDNPLVGASGKRVMWRELLN